MDPFTIALMTAGIICQAGFGVTQRYLLKEKICSQFDILVGGFGFAAIVLASALLWWPESGIAAPDVRIFWIAVAGTTVAGLVIQYAGVRSRAIADVSLTAPVQGMTPLLIACTAVLINEVPTTLGVIGIVLIACGTWYHNRENATTLAEYLLPFRMLWLPANHASLTPAEQQSTKTDTSAIRWAFLSAALGTIGLLFDGILARSGSVAFGYMIQLVIFSLTYAILVPNDGVAIKHPKRWIGMAGFGLLYGLHVVLIMSAFRFAPIAYIGSLKRLTIIVTVLIAWWLLGETKGKRRLLPASIITIGAMILVFDPGSAEIVAGAQSFLLRLLQ